MYQSLGMLEVSGFVTALACIDAMGKSAFVEVYKTTNIGSGMIVLYILGDLASVQYAIEIGLDVAYKQGGLLANSHIIPRPYQQLFEIIN